MVLKPINFDDTETATSIAINGNEQFSKLQGEDTLYNIDASAQKSWNRKDIVTFLVGDNDGFTTESWGVYDGSGTKIDETVLEVPSGGGGNATTKIYTDQGNVSTGYIGDGYANATDSRTSIKTVYNDASLNIDNVSVTPNQPRFPLDTTVAVNGASQQTFSQDTNSAYNIDVYVKKSNKMSLSYSASVGNDENASNSNSYTMPPNIVGGEGTYTLDGGGSYSSASIDKNGSQIDRVDDQDSDATKTGSVSLSPGDSISLYAYGDYAPSSASLDIEVYKDTSVAVNGVSQL